MQSLKECSRCKGQADLHGSQKTTGYYWVECVDCKAKTDNYEQRIDAENAWNKDDLIN